MKLNWLQKNTLISAVMSPVVHDWPFVVLDVAAGCWQVVKLTYPLQGELHARQPIVELLVVLHCILIQS